MSDDMAPPGSLRILLVDDEALVRAGTAMMLDELGHVVVEASSAKQALELLADDAGFDLLMTDFKMPDMDGLEMVERARQRGPAVPVILMTGYSAGDERFTDVGMPRLEKPFGLDALEVVLREAL